MKTIDTESALDRQMKGLMAQTELAKELNINVKTIRPCVARIRNLVFEEGGLFSRSMACSILATELFLKFDYNQDRIEHELIKWNRTNNPPLRISDMRSTLRTAIRNQYNYSCHHDYLKEFCIGHELCMFAKGMAGKRQHNYRAFFLYKWQLILKNVSKLIYWMALPEIEKRYGFKPGSQLYVSQREIAHYSGITLKYVKKGLEELSSYGLIEYKPGVSRKWEGKATEVKRIFPIPKPPKELIKRTKDPIDIHTHVVLICVVICSFYL